MEILSIKTNCSTQDIKCSVNLPSSKGSTISTIVSSSTGAASSVCCVTVGNKYKI